MNRRIRIYERASMRRYILVAVFGACLLAGCAEDSPERLLMTAMQQAAQGDEEAALALLDRSLALAPNDSSILFVRGGLHDSLGDPVAAIADYEKAIELAPHLEAGLAMQLKYLRETVAVMQRSYSTPVVVVPAAAAMTGPTVEHIRFCASRPRGYRNYVLQPDARYRSGETAWIYFDIGNLESRRRFDGRLENALRQSLQLRDPSGTLLADTVIVDEVLIIASNIDGDRLFMRNHIDIPAGAPAGEYRIDLVVVDRFAGATAQVDSSFTVIP